jgi:hypothetical protein
MKNKKIQAQREVQTFQIEAVTKVGSANTGSK